MISRCKMLWFVLLQVSKVDMKRVDFGTKNEGTNIKKCI